MSKPMGDATVVDTARKPVQTPLATWLQVARDEYGKGFASQVMELLRLSRGAGKLQPAEYFMYHLFEDARLSSADKEQFVGVNFVKALDQVTMRNAWTVLAADKPTLTSLLVGLNVPVPETQAIFHPFRSMGGAAPLRNWQQVEKFLTREARYPLFAKPAESVNSLGAVSIESCDASRGVLMLQDGREFEIQALLEGLKPAAEGGYLFQSRMEPHPEMAPILGEGKLGTCRVQVLIDDDGPYLNRATLRIPTGTNVADNLWRKGNMLAALDPETGALTRVVGGETTMYDPIERHPETGAEFATHRFPEWDAVREATLAAASGLPNCKIQGWDVALTVNGPALVELEGNGGHPQMVQLAQGQGLLEGRYAKLVETARRVALEDKGKVKKARNKRIKAALAELRPTESQTQSLHTPLAARPDAPPDP